MFFWGFFVVIVVVSVVFVVVFYPRNLPLKFGQNRVSNKSNVAFVFVCVVVVIVHIVVVIVVVDFTNLPLRFD